MSQRALDTDKALRTWKVCSFLLLLGTCRWSRTIAIWESYIIDVLSGVVLRGFPNTYTGGHFITQHAGRSYR